MILRFPNLKLSTAKQRPDAIVFDGVHDLEALERAALLHLIFVTVPRGIRSGNTLVSKVSMVKGRSGKTLTLCTVFDQRI